jgi:hypothetical protein
MPTSTADVLPPRFINLNLELVENNTMSTTTQKPHNNTPPSDPLPRHHPKMTPFWSIFIRAAIFTLIGFFTSIIVTLLLDLTYDILQEKDVNISDMLQRLVDPTNMSNKVEYLQTLKSTMQDWLRKKLKICKQRLNRTKDDKAQKTIIETSFLKGTSLPWKRICNDYWLLAFTILYVVIIIVTLVSLSIELNMHWLRANGH